MVPGPWLPETPAGAGRREQGVACVYGADGGDQLGRGSGLEQEAGRAGPERVHHVVVEVERRQHHHPGGAELRNQPSSGLDPVEYRHPDVHQDQVGPGFQRTRDGLVSIGRLGDYLDVGLRLEDEPEAAADEGLVVGEQDPDHADAARGSRARMVKPMGTVDRSARATPSDLGCPHEGSPPRTGTTEVTARMAASSASPVPCTRGLRSTLSMRSLRRQV